jgi:hypothetical protein
MPEPKKKRTNITRQSDTELPPTTILKGIEYYSKKDAAEYVGMSPAGFHHRIEKLKLEYPEKTWQVHLPGSNKTLIQKDHLDFMLTPIPGPAPDGEDEDEDE